MKQFDIWLADLDPRFGTEPGKIRPVLIIQTDDLNDRNHKSTIICPITTQIMHNVKILRLNLQKNQANLSSESDILMDQIRTIDNKRFVKKIGELPDYLKEKVCENLRIILNLEF